MSALKAWFVTVLVLLTGVFALHQMGLDISSLLASVVHGLENALGHPLVMSG
jgi:hypothetical protein